MNLALARLIAGQICIHASMTGMRMAAPLLALREGYSAVAVGMLLALFALTQVFLALPAGRYADRHGLRRPVKYAVIVAAVGCATALAFPVYAALCFAALCTGAATGTATIALQRHVGRAAHDATQLRQVFSWLAIGPAVSNFIGPFFAGLLIDHAGSSAGSTDGYRAAFAMMMVTALLTWLWVRHAQELPPVIAADDGRGRKAWDLLGEPNFRRLLILNWLLSSCWDVHTFVVPLLGHERGLSASVIGTILGIFALAAALIRVLMPFIAERLREATVLCWAMAITALLFAVYPLMPTAFLLGTCSVLLGLALGSVQPMIMSMLHQLTPPERHGEALGLRLMAINGSSVLMPVIFGYAGALVGVAGLFWIVGAAVGSGSRIAWKMRGVEASGHAH
ncbi:MFS transporter [Diaphorobacter ruginosibacter]|uniref:MFS transporter n=1 Tax=Diaphorobacter ruginosibacter TaxID=1715720 RepID=A0A7G9RJ12_9BURK|nr:MFS transporter [Diaphorobacter ruginosibacter]QNN55587.1 MFS transporter [Diaphorobacter ruginosibacter]